MKKSLKNKIDKEIDNYIDRSINILASNAALAFITGEIKADKLMGTSFDKPSPDSLEYARDYKALLVDKGATIINGEEIPWLADREKELRQQVYDSIEQGFKEGRKTYGSGSIADDIAEILGTEHWKAQRIARTEVKRIMNAGTIVRYNRNNVKFVQVLDNEGDNSCDECAEINGQIWTVEYAQSHELQHPNCVRSFVPMFEEDLPEDFVPDDEMILGQAPNPEFTKQLLQSKFSNMGKLRREDDLSAAQDKDKLLALKEYKSMYYSQHNRYLRRGEAGIKYHLQELGGFRIDSPDDRDYHMIKEYMEASKRSTDLIRELMRDSSVEKDTLASRGISYRVAKEILETGIYNERGFGSWSTEDLISYTFPLNSNYGSKENDYTKYILKSVLPEGLAAVEGVYAEREIVTIDGLSYRVIKSETLTPLQYVLTARSEEKLSKYDIDYNTNVLKGLGYQKVVVIELELIGAVE